MRHKNIILRSIFLVLILTLLFPLISLADGGISTPTGNALFQSFGVTLINGTKVFVHVCYNNISMIQPGHLESDSNFVTRDIIDCNLKSVNGLPVVFTLSLDGTVNSYPVTPSGPSGTTLGKIDPSNAGQFFKITGDDMYTLSNLALYVSPDNGKTWKTDTAGLNGAYLSDVSTDSGQNAYIATYKGLYRQAPKSSTWSSVNAPYTMPSKVFGASNGMLFLSENFDLSMSKDNGKTWNTDTAGLHYSAPIKFCQDSAGNIYVITAPSVYNTTSGNGLYKYASTGWVDIGKSFLKMNYDPAYTQVFNNITGGSTLYLATNFGAFTSADGGNTWKNTDNAGAQNITGMAITSNGNQIMSTSLGVFYKTTGSNTWVKSFPTNGYMTGQKIFKDKNGALYTTGRVLSLYNPYPREVLKSTDNGKTWMDDTAGIYLVNGKNFYVDENGNQYMGTTTSQTYIKRPGGSWQYDTTGLLKSPSYGQMNAWGSDGQGNVYASATTINASFSSASYVYRRAVSSSTWIIDSLGWPPTFTAYYFANDKNGNIYAGTANGGVLKRTGGKWKQLSYPPSINANTAFAIAADKSGALFGAFSNYNYNNTPLGVYMTKDTGAHWTKVGTDSFSFYQMVSGGDTVFGLAYFAGVYAFTENSTGIENRRDNIKHPVLLFPNPVQSAMNISLPEVEKAVHQITITDLQGRAVHSFSTNRNSQNMQLDVSCLPAGIYILSISSEEGIQRVKFMKE